MKPTPAASTSGRILEPQQEEGVVFLGVGTLALEDFLGFLGMRKYKHSRGRSRVLGAENPLADSRAVRDNRPYR